MSQPVGICFLEDAACVLLKESSWRRCSEAEAAGISSAPRESCSMDRLLLFLGRALTFTRRSLYVLLCVNPHKSPPSSLPSPPEDACSAAEKQQCKNAAAFVSCGPEVWKLYVQLSAKLGNLAQRLELPATPIILPWEAENFAADKETTNQESGCCSHWAARARAAVLRHYLMASAGCLRWKPRDEAARCHAIPLVLDEEFTCSDADACSAWPRHWRLTSSAAVTSGSGVRKRVACSLEGTREFLPSEHEGDPSTSGRADAATTFKYTVAAGTFDRLHAGHRLLLAAAVFAASEATGLALAAGPLVTKTRPSMSNSTADIEPFSFRLRAATAFVQLAAAARNLALSISGYTEAIQEECGLLTQQQQQQQQQQVSGRFEGISGSAGLLPQRAPLQEQQAAEQQGGRPRLRLQVFRITDSIGPADRLSFDCLVVSAETLRGAHAVNEVRLKLGNEPVSFLTVELVPSCAQPSPRVFEALHATLPFTKKTGSLHGDTTSGSGSSAGEKASRLPVGAKLELRGTAVVEDQLDTPKGSTLSLSLAAGKETPQGKVSSTELRYLHWKQLGCDCVGWLCGRFHASWCWLLRDRGSCLESTNSAPPAVWQLLCAEHAAPWRRLHTFERIARLLRRLDAEQHSESAEPVVLAVFLGSLLACPCQSLPQITDACATPDGSSQTSASPNWAPPAEAEWWRAAASSLLSELNSYCCEAGAKDKGQTGGHSRKGSTACKHTSLLRALMTAQRASSIATLATPFEPAAGKQNASFTEACGTQASSLDEEAALVKTACRLELLECTSSAFLPLAAGMQQLRDEYFFVEEAQFKRWRELQLRQVLNDADSLTPLKQEEHRHAVVSIKRELEMLTPALTTKVEAATDRTKQS